MDKDKLVEELIQFLCGEAACLETLACLNSKAEVAIRIAQSIDIRVVYSNGEVMAKKQEPLAPDFIFDATPEAIAILISEKGLTPAQLGIKFVKQILSRDIRVSMPSSIFQITRKGYFKILTLGGSEFFVEMKKHNLASLPKIIAALKKKKPSSE